MASKLFYRSSVKYARPFKVYRVKIRSLYIFQFCIQNSDSRHKNAWMLLTSSASNTKEDKFEHIPSEARQLRHRNLTVLWRTCKSREINKVRTMFCFFFPSVLRWLKSIYPGLKVTAILSARTDPIDRWQLLLFEVGHSQMIHAWPCCHIRKAKRKWASVLHNDHVLQCPCLTDVLSFNRADQILIDCLATWWKIDIQWKNRVKFLLL